MGSVIYILFALLSIDKTVFGAIVYALNIRKNNGYRPITCLSCDNLIKNGDKLKQAVIGIAKNINKDLSDWILENCTFPNSMVDCIVPSTGERELELVKKIGINDSVPVVHENFRQWVVEDKFCSGRPNWEDVGVQFSSKVHQYEEQKIRILNAGHQIIANAAELLSIDTIDKAMKHEGIYFIFYSIVCSLLYTLFIVSACFFLLSQNRLTHSNKFPSFLVFIHHIIINFQ